MKSTARTQRNHVDMTAVFAVAVLLATVPTIAGAQERAATADRTNVVVRTVAQATTGDCAPDPTQDPTRDPIQEVTPAPAPKGGPAEGFLPEPSLIRRGISFATRTIGDGSKSNDGFYPEFSYMPTGSGWISIGPGYRHSLFTDRAVVEGSAAISWRMYKIVQSRFEFTNLAHSRLALGSQLLWQDLTQVSYFGVGPDTEEADRSEYRIKSTNVIGYATYRPKQWASVSLQGGWLNQPTLSSPGGTFKRGNPDALAVFADEAALKQPLQPDYLHEQISVTADTRDFRSHPWSGGVYRASMAAYSDRSTGLFSFRRYEAEAAHFVPLADRRIVLAGHAWLVGTGTVDNETVPFYLMPSLGGSNTIRAHTDYRFHDRNLLVVNAESRFALWTHLDLAAFADAGNVGPRMADLDLSKRAYGLGIRMHTGRATFLRLDAAHGSEGWRIVFRSNDPLHLTRLSRRTAAVPFAP